MEQRATYAFMDIDRLGSATMAVCGLFIGPAFTFHLFCRGSSLQRSPSSQSMGLSVVGLTISALTMGGRSITSVWPWSARSVVGQKAGRGVQTLRTVNAPSGFAIKGT